MNFMKMIIATLLLFAVHLPLVEPAGAADTRNIEVAGTPHNLSSTVQTIDEGRHGIRSTVEPRICIFCHAPHHATSITPLWSREPSNITYTLYESNTLSATLQQPRGASRLCLSCHDGTVALGLLSKTLNYNLDTSLPSIPLDADPKYNANLGTDLSDDHPISFIYPSSPELWDPSTLRAEGVRLEADLYVECTSCHNPHDNRNGNFLVINTDAQHDALCTKCHNKAGWSGSAHKTGGTRYPSVKDAITIDGCRSCHLPHSAPGRVSLVKSAAEENNCFIACHKDLPYSVNVYSQFLKPYGHPVQNYMGTHFLSEKLPVAGDKKHVECVDCHNPHEVGSVGAPMSPPNALATPPTSAPAVTPALQGVRGVDELAVTTVNSASYEFQICFKCHGGLSSDKFVPTQFGSDSVLRPTRIIQTFDESLRFASKNPSFHPLIVDRPSRPGAGRSLLTGFKETLVRIYCTDCHSAHGSDEPHVLDARYPDTFPSTTTDYPLCNRCHDNTFLMSASDSASMHQKHVYGLHNNGDNRAAPCSVCHDPHGVPADRGATIPNSSHLINFDARYVGRDSVYDSVLRSCSITPGPSGACHVTNPKLY